MKTGIVLVLLLMSSGAARSADVQGVRPSISPDRMEFGIQDVGTQGEAQPVTLTNPGPAAVEIASILTSGIDFSQTNDCGKTLAPGAQCTIHLAFKPATIGPRIGQLSVIASVPIQPQSVPLAGTGR